MKLTPGKNISQHSIQGTIYKRSIDSGDANIIYHCHAPITEEALINSPVWTIWREDLTTGKLTPPKSADKSKPKPDNNICNNLESMSFWEVPEPGIPLTIDNSSIRADQDIFTVDQMEF
jgi:hypothetical protein